jgi:hypothetical protein
VTQSPPRCRQHTWQLRNVVLLTLPDSDGFADRSMWWACTTCGLECEIDGYIKVGAPTQTPAYWTAFAEQEQRRGTPEAKEAQRQQRRRRR